MFELYFGIAWLCIVIPIGVSTAIPCILLKDWGGVLLVLVWFVIMGGVGFIFLGKGLQYIKRKKEIDTLGDLAYGIIVNMVPTGKYVNNLDVLKAKVALLTDDGGHAICEEDVGTHPVYDIGQIIVVQYYQDNINFKGCADMHAIPVNVKNKLLSIYDKYNTGCSNRKPCIPEINSNYTVEDDNVITTYNY